MHAVSFDAALGLARKHTGRRKVFFVVPPGSQPEIPFDDDCTAILTNRVSEFCRALAASEVRIAAIFVQPDTRDMKVIGFLREVRELTSAEGACLLLEESSARSFADYGICADLICRPAPQ